jgi:hypothetical protein
VSGVAVFTAGNPLEVEKVASPHQPRMVEAHIGPNPGIDVSTSSGQCCQHNPGAWSVALVSGIDVVEHLSEFAATMSVSVNGAGVTRPDRSA